MIVRRDGDSAAREVLTDVGGIFTFEELAAGGYTVQTLYGNANTTRNLDLEPDHRARLDIALDPTAKPRIDPDTLIKWLRDGDVIRVPVPATDQ